jgi:uncharacterized protein YecT (DUF1311 family)
MMRNMILKQPSQVLFTIAIYLIAFTSPLRATQCDSAAKTGGTQGRAICENEVANNFDKQLDVQWNKVLKDFKLGNSNQLKLLVDAQRAWIKYRNAQCGLESSFYLNPTAFAISAECEQRLTQERLKDLQIDFP